MAKTMTDTELLNWFERKWKREDDCPVEWSGEGFTPNTTGLWKSKLTLREAIRQAMDPRPARKRLDAYFAKKEGGNG